METSMRVRKTRQNSIGWMIQRLSSRLDDAMNERLSGLGLTIQQFAIMMRVLEHERMTQAEIGRMFAMPAYKISRALDSLEAAGYVVRQDHPSSRRAHQIWPTEKGLALGPELFDIVRTVNADLTYGLSDEEADALKRLLATVMDTAAI